MIVWLFAKYGRSTLILVYKRQFLILEKVKAHGKKNHAGRPNVTLYKTRGDEALRSIGCHLGLFDP